MSDLATLLKEIQNPEVSHVDMIKRRCTITTQWFLEKDVKTHPIHNNNDLQFFMCGQEGFASIERDILAATSSIDLVLWGFDPGMELSRKGSVWPRGTTYGDLLSSKARQGVKVRLLVHYAGDVPIVGYVPFYNPVASGTGNVPDMGRLSGVPLPSFKPSDLKAPDTSGKSRDEVLKLREEYCRAWWNDALHGAFGSLEVRLRCGHPIAIARNAAKYLPTASGTLIERAGMQQIATHHQKPILIDYAPGKDQRDKANTCAYVMGLNSVTDYWDTTEHRYNATLRECSPHGAYWTKLWRLKPYRDYAIRVQGEALYNINENFVQGWDNADGYGGAHGAHVFSASLEKERQHIRPKDIPVPAGARCRAQILRTYPDKQDSTILKAYTLASSNAVNYIYVENQYFQLADWPQMIKQIRQQYCQGMADAGAKPSDIAPLHVFVVTPQPERDQMVPNTYDTLNQLGQGQGVSTYDKQVREQREAKAPGFWQQAGGVMVRGARVVVDPVGSALDAAQDVKQAGKERVLNQSIQSAPANPVGELDAMGIKTLAAMLMTHDSANEAKDILIKERDNNAQTEGAKHDAQRNAGKGLNKGKASDVDSDNYSEYNIRPGRYREIYIHSKLMFVDDVFTTLGSANLNARSMVGDSEFNICTEEWAFTKAARKRVWGNLAGADLDGKTCTRAETAEVFDKWKRRMANNKDARSAGNPPENGSFIHPFEDPRGAPILRLV
jgi:phosphatidylserine/phosphatidylglycerophosphate/cardiolipin synthase-like enzyme